MVVKLMPTGLKVENKDGSLSDVPMELCTEGSKTTFKAEIPNGNKPFTITGEFSEMVDTEGEPQ